MSIQSRRPAGSPASTGGQFSQTTLAEAEVDLAGGHEHLQEVFEAADRTAASADRRNGYSRRLADADAEDIRQNALEQWWYDKQRGRTVDDDKAYARTSAYFFGTKLADRMRAEDRRANKLLHTWVSGFEQSEGRHPTGIEREAEAQAIRDRWTDRRHLPSEDFHRRDMAGPESSWNKWTTDEGDDLLSNMASAGAHSSLHSLASAGSPQSVDESRSPLHVAPGTWAAVTLSMAEGTNGRRRHLLGARKIACAALAEARQAPLPQVGALSSAAVSKAKTQLKRYDGGVAGAISTWRQGRDDQGTTALFAPFSNDLDEGGRDQVCDLLESGDDPEVLWGSAAWIADARNRQTLSELVSAPAAAA